MLSGPGGKMYLTKHGAMVVCHFAPVEDLNVLTDITLKSQSPCWAEAKNTNIHSVDDV